MEEKSSERVPITEVHWPSEGVLIRIQALSGAAFATFATIHLANSVSANFGYHLYDGLQELLRKYYQNPIVEISLAGALTVHVGTSLARVWRRFQRNAKKQTETKSVFYWPKLEWTPLSLHRYTGYFLSAIIGVHINFTRGISLRFGQPNDFSTVSFSLTRYPIVFYPYYALLATSGLYHTYFGILQVCKLFGIKVPPFLSTRGKFFWGTMGVGTISLLSAILAFGGNYFPIPIDRFVWQEKIHEQTIPHLLKVLLK